MNERYSFREEVLFPLVICAGIGFGMCASYRPSFPAPVERDLVAKNVALSSVREEDLIPEPIYRAPFPPLRSQKKTREYNLQMRSYAQRRVTHIGRTRR